MDTSQRHSFFNICRACPQSLDAERRPLEAAGRVRTGVRPGRGRQLSAVHDALVFVARAGSAEALVADAADGEAAVQRHVVAERLPTAVAPVADAAAEAARFCAERRCQSELARTAGARTKPGPLHNGPESQISAP